MRCCKKPAWDKVSDLNHMIGEFRDKGVEALSLFRCGVCGSYRLDVDTNSGRKHCLPIPRHRGDRMREADQEFWKLLKEWTRS